MIQILLITKFLLINLLNFQMKNFPNWNIFIKIFIILINTTK